MNALRTFRDQRSLTQGQLAVLLGVTKSTVSRWEAGVRRVDKELLPIISEKTGISVADLRPDLAALLKGAQ